MDERGLVDNGWREERKNQQGKRREGEYLYSPEHFINQQVTPLTITWIFGGHRTVHAWNGLFIFTGATDLLDGYIARNFKNQKSVLGSIIDPLADKCLISVLTISLTVSSLIPVPLTALIVARDIGLVGAASYMRYKSLAPPITLSRYFDVSHATVQLKPTFVSKINTAVQLVLVGVTLPAPIFHYVDHISLQYLWYITAATTILSGLSYILSKNTVEFLRTTKRK
ncbi:putative cardiolipin synthase (CMP-forming) [Apostichopus japonicus]|uniref:cardiolipin synthase (CMP-forming) n=1 Tax=Stichopus japonicus TaxID=307972 RepID=A0A2G8LA44_STIJA|nr:putative cardiolipin synthase (CMP-forming) [Apostichopus japonicus]